MWNILASNSIMKIEDFDPNVATTASSVTWPTNLSLHKSQSISNNQNTKGIPKVSSKCGVPQSSPPTRWTAPVHLDVGGTIYTTTLITLTKYPESKLAKLFNGTLPVILDELKQHYFIDRDGPLFRHILNFLRDGKCNVTAQFTEIDQLIDEASFFELEPMLQQLKSLQLKMTEQNSVEPSIPITNTKDESDFKRVKLCKRISSNERKYKRCLLISVSPELQERILISGSRNLICCIFPTLQCIMDKYSPGSWNSKDPFWIRLPLNGYLPMSSIEAMETVFEFGLELISSCGGGVEGQQFSEYMYLLLLFLQHCLH